MFFFSECKELDLDDIIAEQKLKKQVLQLKISFTGHFCLLVLPFAKYFEKHLLDGILEGECADEGF